VKRTRERFARWSFGTDLLVSSVLSEIFTFVIKLWLMVFMVQTSEENVTTGKS